MGSTGNQSGTSSAYPPSLYDTSVSSASGGNKNQYSSMKQYSSRANPLRSGHYMQQQTPELSRSINCAEYQHHPPDITAMSDPGGPLQSNHDSYISKVRYARSDIQVASPELQRFRDSSRLLQNNEKSQSINSIYPSSRRMTQSPPPNFHHQQQLQLQQDEGRYRPQRQYSRDRDISREISFVSTNEDEGDNDYNDHQPDASSSSTVNIKDLKKQLWNDDEILQVRIPSPSPPTTTATLQSQVQESIRGSSPSYKESRFVRSLSPRRQEYHKSFISDNRPPIRKAGSTISETSSFLRNNYNNNKFHSKFYEAAVVAQNIGNSNDCQLGENDPEKPPQQRRRSSSSRDFDDENSNYNCNRRYAIPLSSTKTASETISKNYDETVAKYYRKKRDSPQIDNNVGKGRRPPIIPPSPSSHSSDVNIEQQGRRQQEQRQQSFVHRGRNTKTSRRYSDADTGPSIEQELNYNGVDDDDDDIPLTWGREDHHVRGEGMNGNIDNGNNFNNGNSASWGRRATVADSATMRKSFTDQYGSRSKHLVDHSQRQRAAVDEAIESHKEVKYRREQQNPHDRSRHHDNETGKVRMANLVDKLSAVNRDDPETALVQIDSILRQESLGPYHIENFRKPRYTPESSPNGQLDDDDDEDEDDTFNNDGDDDESDVSSITNPTFQQGSSRQHHDRVRAVSKKPDLLYIQENNHYSMHNVASTNIGIKDACISKSPFNPSTSSFRRPRPSQLLNYTMSTTTSPPPDTTKDSFTMSRSERKRQQLKNDPPPSTINMKDDMANIETPIGQSNDVRLLQSRDKFIQQEEIEMGTNIESSHSKKHTSNVSQGSSTAMMLRGKPKKKLDKFIADKEGLAEKIRVWDDLSNQMSKSRSEQDENIKNVEKRTRALVEPHKINSRRHPWDESSMDFVRTKDTSMDGAIGVETEMAVREDHYNFERNTSETEADSHESSSDNLMPNINQPLKRIPQFNLHKQERSKYEQKIYKDKTKENDITWEAIPPSSFFPDINKDCEPVLNEKYQKQEASSLKSSSPDWDPNCSAESIYRYPSKSQRHSRSSTDFSSRKMCVERHENDPVDQVEFQSSRKEYGKGEDPIRTDQLSKPKNSQPSDIGEFLGGTRYEEEINLSIVDVNKVKVRNENRETESRSIARSLACTTVGSRELRPKDKRRGFLRAFMDRKKKKATASAGYAASTGSVAAHSISVESRGVKSMSQINSSSRSHCTQSHSVSNGTLRILPDTRNGAVVDKRSREQISSRSASAPRPRSNSLEKFRTASMAQKFNRVIQLYDTDEI